MPMSTVNGPVCARVYTSKRRSSYNLPVLPLRVVPQSDFIGAHCKSILCTRSFPMGYW